MEPIASVIITTFRRPEYLKEAIDSVLDQRFRDIELIIVNDAPGDTEADKIGLSCKGEDRRVKYINNNRHLGSTKSLNEGLRIAEGRYIAILDDDDVWISRDKLSVQVKFLEDNKDYVLVGTNIIAVESGSEKEISRSRFALTDKKIRKNIFLNNPFAHSSVLYAKDAVLSVGGYDESLERGKDYDLWLRLGKTGKMAVLPELMVKYRIADLSGRDMIRIKRDDSGIKSAIMKKHSASYRNFIYSYAVERLRHVIFSVLAALQEIFNLRKAGNG